MLETTEYIALDLSSIDLDDPTPEQLQKIDEAVAEEAMNYHNLITHYSSSHWAGEMHVNMRPKDANGLEFIPSGGDGDETIAFSPTTDANHLRLAILNLSNYYQISEHHFTDGCNLYAWNDSFLGVMGEELFKICLGVIYAVREHKKEASEKGVV